MVVHYKMYGNGLENPLVKVPVRLKAVNEINPIIQCFTSQQVVNIILKQT